MRCLSPHANYSIQVFEGKEEIVRDPRGYAQTLVLEQPVVADFQQGGMLDHEIEVALEMFNFSGVPEGINPLTRVATFDTEAYVQRLPKDRQDSVLVKMDERMRELSTTLAAGEFVIVETPRQSVPWPSYPDCSAEEVLALYERLKGPAGKPLAERIRLYELENDNRDEIVKAMLMVEDPEAARAQFPEEGEAVAEVTA